MIPDNDNTWREAQRIAQRNLESWWERQAAATPEEPAIVSETGEPAANSVSAAEEKEHK
jgi:hypothetical protein